MPTPPTPLDIVTNPDPLNPAGFPFAVVAFPGDWLLQEGDFNVPKDLPRTPAPGAPINYEPGQH